MAEASTKSEQQASWARVAILLNLGDVQAATVAARQASAMTVWYRRFGSFQSIGNARIYDSFDMPAGWMWFEPDRERVLLSRVVVSRFGLSRVMFSFAETVTRLDRAAFRRFDVDNWLAEDNLNRKRLGMEPTDR